MDWDPSALSPTPYDIGRLLVETDSGIELIRPDAVRIVRGEAAEYVLAVQEATLDGGDLLTAVVVLGDSGPMLVGGAEPVLTQASPPVWVAVAPEQDLWVATDDGIPSAGRLSDSDLPFETDADGIPVPVGRR